MLTRWARAGSSPQPSTLVKAAVRKTTWGLSSWTSADTAAGSPRSSRRRASRARLSAVPMTDQPPASRVRTKALPVSPDAPMTNARLAMPNLPGIGNLQARRVHPDDLLGVVWVSRAIGHDRPLAPDPLEAVPHAGGHRHQAVVGLAHKELH